MSDNPYGPPARDGDEVLKVHLYRSTVLGEDCLVAEYFRPGLGGTVRRTWSLESGRLSSSQLQDLGSWVELTIRGAVIARVHLQDGLFTL